MKTETNAKDEFMFTVGTGAFSSKLICARISYQPDYYTETIFSLKPGYTEDDYQEFLKALDFTYNASYGRQYVFGTIWFEEGVWYDRYEYDGSECWQRNKYPGIPPIEEFGPIVQTIIAEQEEEWDGDDTDHPLHGC